MNRNLIYLYVLVLLLLPACNITNFTTSSPIRKVRANEAASVELRNVKQLEMTETEVLLFDNLLTENQQTPEFITIEKRWKGDAGRYTLVPINEEDKPEIKQKHLKKAEIKKTKSKFYDDRPKDENKSLTTMAMTGFILSITGLFLPLLSLAGLVVSHIAWMESKKYPENSKARSMAIAGLIIGIAGSLYLLLAGAYFAIILIIIML